MASWEQANEAARKRLRGVKTYLAATVAAPLVPMFQAALNDQLAPSALAFGLASVATVMLTQSAQAESTLQQGRPPSRRIIDLLDPDTGSSQPPLAPKKANKVASRQLARLKATSLLSFLTSTGLSVTAMSSGEEVSAGAAGLTALIAVATHIQAGRAGAALETGEDPPPVAGLGGRPTPRLPIAPPGPEPRSRWDKEPASGPSR